MHGPMPDWLYHAVFPILRWLHIVACALIVGGTLFYEFVIPHAIDDLRDETQLLIFGRVRWVFGSVVLWCTVLLMLTGAASLWRLWSQYTSYGGGTIHAETNAVRLAGWWVVGHVVLGILVLALAIRLTFSLRVPPMSWMRVSFVMLLVTIFLGSAARHVALFDREQRDLGEAYGNWILPRFPTTSESPTTMPSPPASPTTEAVAVPSTNPVEGR